MYSQAVNKRKHIFAYASCVFMIGFFFASVLLIGNTEAEVLDTDAENKEQQTGGKMTVVIDAGHGGEDGGAVSASGISEKTLNLSIALTLGDMLSASGVNVVYTRTEDNGLYEGAVPGHRKMADLKNRLAVWQAYPDAILLSLHMNTFSLPEYSGMQVFYSKNDPQSRVLAELIRQTNQTYLQKDNTRTAKEADSAIFLLDRCPGTAVLAECGFLSNPEEAELLSLRTYRECVAGVLCASILEYFHTIGET